MNLRQKTRRALAAVSVTSLALSLVACGASGDPSADAASASNGESSKVRVGQWVAGAISTTALTTKLLSENDQIEQDNDIDVEFVEYTNLQSLYTDMATGRVDVVVGGPESFASSASQGSPVTLAGSFSRSNAAILSVDSDELTADSLRGKRVVAPTATSTWALVRDQIEALTGLVAEKDYEVVTAESSAAALQQLAAGTADFAAAWGEALIEGPKTFGTIKVIADHKELAGEDEPFIQFVIATNNKTVDVETGHRLMDAYADQVAAMENDPSEAEAAGVAQGREAGTVEEMITSGLMNYDVKAFPGAESEELLAGLEAAVESGQIEKMPPTSFIPEG